MDFNDTPEQAAFRAEARAWLEANVPDDWREHLKGDEEDIAVGQAWQSRKADAGWACINWPEKYGGRDGSPIQQVIWEQEEGELAQLCRFNFLGIGLVAPTLMCYASEEQKRLLLPRIARADDLWCQLFSEPAAGSDLAGIRSRAEGDGGDWIVNGQKIWVTSAHLSDYGVLLTRSDPNLPKHHGLTYFYVDMRSPGIEVRPIRQIDGEAEYSEVFLTDVRIPDSQRLGNVGDGWKVALTTLMSERATAGTSMLSTFNEMFSYLKNLYIDDVPALQHAAVRDRMADFYVNDAGIRNSNLRAVSALSKGRLPGPEASIGKLVMARQRQDEASFLLDLQNYAGILTDCEIAEGEGFFQKGFFRCVANRIEGGTDEILRNIIAERVLGLPGELRIDKDVAFEDVSSSK